VNRSEHRWGMTRATLTTVGTSRLVEPPPKSIEQGARAERFWLWVGPFSPLEGSIEGASMTLGWSLVAAG
jgi:hypothetical protein